MTPEKRTGPHHGAGPKAATTATVSVEDRRRAARELDALLGIESPPYVCTCPDHWATVGMSLGVVERDYAARDLAGVAV